MLYPHISNDSRNVRVLCCLGIRHVVLLFFLIINNNVFLLVHVYYITQDTPILDLHGSINALDPCNNCYTITTGGRGREERKQRTPSISEVR